jgi:hypothetical protein
MRNNLIHLSANAVKAQNARSFRLEVSPPQLIGGLPGRREEVRQPSLCNGHAVPLAAALCALQVAYVRSAVSGSCSANAPAWGWDHSASRISAVLSLGRRVWRRAGREVRVVLWRLAPAPGRPPERGRPGRGVSSSWVITDARTAHYLRINAADHDACSLDY